MLPAGWVILSVPLRILCSSAAGKQVVQVQGNYFTLVWRKAYISNSSNDWNDKFSSKLFKIISRHLPSVHAYADDTQLYQSFKAGDDVNEKSAIAAIEACVLDIHKWMLSDRLKLNMDKTEFLLIGTKRQQEKVNITTLRLGDTTWVPGLTPSWTCMNI